MFEAVADSLLRNPNVVEEISLVITAVSDDTGIKLARLVLHSSTIRELELRITHITETTHRAFAMALCVNTSLRALYLCNNKTVRYDPRTRTMFAYSLWINPIRPDISDWRFYDFVSNWPNDFDRSLTFVRQLDAPSMLTRLYHCARNVTRTKIRAIYFFFFERHEVKMEKDGIIRSATEALALLYIHSVNAGWFDLSHKNYADVDVAKLVERMPRHPDAIKCLYFGHNELTDETGVKLARVVATSRTIEMLCLSSNKLGDGEVGRHRGRPAHQHLAALLVSGRQQGGGQNASRRRLHERASRHIDSIWQLYEENFLDGDFERLSAAPPVML